MAKNRFINTKFWSDSWVVELDHIERYLFLYLLTNEHTNICGIYELPLVRMAQETGIDKEMLPKILKRFFDDKKVIYTNGWVYIKNFSKHQRSNESVRIGIENALLTIPKEIMAQIKQIETDWVQTVRDCDQLESEFEFESESKPERKVAKNKFSHEGAEVLKLFETVNPSISKYYGNTTQRAACDRLLKRWTLAQIAQVVGILPEINASRYAKGKSITPLQLEENLGFIKAYIDQKKKDKPKVAIIS